MQPSHVAPNFLYTSHFQTKKIKEIHMLLKTPFIKLEVNSCLNTCLRLEFTSRGQTDSAKMAQNAKKPSASCSTVTDTFLH